MSSRLGGVLLRVTVTERPVPEPGAGQVQVRIKLRPVNPSDIFGICGAHLSFQPASLPAVPGGEGAAQLGCAKQGGSKSV